MLISGPSQPPRVLFVCLGNICRSPAAEGIARIALARRLDADLPRPAPIYLRPADAAPARDRGPVMLP